VSTAVHAIIVSGNLRAKVLPIYIWSQPGPFVICEKHAKRPAFLPACLSLGCAPAFLPASTCQAISSAVSSAVHLPPWPPLQGLVWRDFTLYEAEVSLLQRLLVDVPLSGGAWLYVPSAAAAAEVLGPNRTPPAAEAAATSTTDTAAAAAAAAGAQRGPPGGGWRAVSDAERVSSCDLEIVAPWQALVCLSPDATQLADPSWSPFASSGDGCGSSSSEALPAAEAVPPAARHAADAAKRGDIAGLRMMVLDVLAAAADGADR
jgi:DNA polymerase delta subunit 1